jgi:excisionase family DNA binding protein
MTQMTTPILPSPRDTELSRMLSTKLEAKGDANVLVRDLPDSVLMLVRQILTEMAQGHAVSLSALPKELSTQQAATVLGVSRPFVIKLMDEGQILIYEPRRSTVPIFCTPIPAPQNRLTNRADQTPRSPNPT